MPVDVCAAGSDQPRMHKHRRVKAAMAERNPTGAPASDGSLWSQGGARQRRAEPGRSQGGAAGSDNVDDCTEQPPQGRRSNRRHCGRRPRSGRRSAEDAQASSGEAVGSEVSEQWTRQRPPRTSQLKRSGKWDTALPGMRGPRRRNEHTMRSGVRCRRGPRGAGWK